VAVKRRPQLIMLLALASILGVVFLGLLLDVCCGPAVGGEDQVSRRLPMSGPLSSVLIASSQDIRVHVVLGLGSIVPIVGVNSLFGHGDVLIVLWEVEYT